MYTPVIVECESFLQARIVRIMTEGEGWPAVAVEVRAEGGEGRLAYAVVSAPFDAVNNPLLKMAVMLYAKLGEAGLKRAQALADGRTKLPRVGAVPEALRDAVRHALLAMVTQAAEGTVDIVNIEPALDELLLVTSDNHDPGDEHNLAPVHNPEGGGWETRCPPEGTYVFEADDPYDGWKSAR